MAQDLFAPPTKEELAATSGGASNKDLFAPPTKEELANFSPQENPEGFMDAPISNAVKWSAGVGLRGLEKVGQTLDKYGGAPTRAALKAGFEQGSPKAGLLAFKGQFGEDPALAPTGKQLAQEIGVPDTALSDVMPGLYHEAGQGIKIPTSLDELKSGKYSRELGLEKGGLLDPTASGAVGLGIDVAADPLNFIPISEVSKLSKIPGAIEKMPGAMKAFSESKAIKQAGGMLKDFRKLVGKDKVADYGQALLRETVPVLDESGKVVGESPIMAFGDTVEGVADKVATKKQELGKALGDLYKDTQGGVNEYILSDKADPEVLNKLSSSTPSISSLKQEVIPEIKGALKGKSKSGPVKAVENYLDDLLEDYGNKPLDLMDLHQLKSEIGREIKWNRAEFPNRDLAFKELYRNISNKIDQHMSVLDSIGAKSGDEARLGQLKDLNKRFSIMTDIDAMASDKVARNEANRMFSPSDYGAGIGGAVIGTMKHGDPVSGLLMGAATGAGNKIARSRGAGMLSRAADVGARVGEQTSQLPAGLLRSALELDRPVGKMSIKALSEEEKKRNSK